MGLFFWAFFSHWEVTKLIFCQNQSYPIVIKADGLAAGKGVIICQTMESIITEAGYNFVSEMDGLRAIAILLSRKPDLIFQKEDCIGVIFDATNKTIVKQVQHLLLRFGIVSHLEEKSVQDQGSQKQTWQLKIKDAFSIKVFLDEIGIDNSCVSSQKISNPPLSPLQRGENRFPVDSELIVIDNQKNSLGSRQSQLACRSKKQQLQQLNDRQIYWDEITAIEYVGQKQVYDLTIPETHNFVANDICVHNTSFALNIAANIAKGQDLAIAIFSLEMSREQLAMRLLSGEARLESSRLKSGRITEQEMEPLMEAMGTLSELPLYIDDTANVTVMQMRSEVRRLQAEKKGKLGLVLIDYLQLMEGSSDNRVQELSRITRSLKGLAREINVPIIALSQLSRAVEQRTNKRPMLSDLRESGAIEQDADIVMMLYRDEYYNPDTVDQGIAEIIIAKHRNGPTGQVKMIFRSEFTQFLNLKRD